MCDGERSEALQYLEPHRRGLSRADSFLLRVLCVSVVKFLFDKGTGQAGIEYAMHGHGGG
jgi:hypothetical protein